MHRCEFIFNNLTMEERLFLSQYGLDTVLRKILNINEIKMFENLVKKGAVNKGKHVKSHHIVYQVESFIYSRL